MQAVQKNFMLGVRNSLLSSVGGNGCKIQKEPWFLVSAPLMTLEDQIKAHDMQIKDLINQKWNAD